MPAPKMIGCRSGPAGHARADKHHHDINRHQACTHIRRFTQKGHPSRNVHHRSADIHNHDRHNQQPQAVPGEAEQCHANQLETGHYKARTPWPGPVRPAPEARRQEQIEQRQHGQIADNINAIPHGLAGQMQAEPHPDRKKYPEIQALDRP